MNIEQLENQMDSAIHSLRKRFRRLSAGSTSASASSPSSVHRQSSPLQPHLGYSLPSSAAASPSTNGNRKGLSLRSRESLRKLMRRTKMPPKSGEEEGRGGESRRGTADDNSTLPSDENLAWTAPVSPQLGGHQNGNSPMNPRRRNSARLRELQQLLRAYHEQREAWLSPPSSPKLPKSSNDPKDSRNKEEKQRKSAKHQEAKFDGIGKEEGANDQLEREWHSPPLPLHYSPWELGMANPLQLSQTLSILDTPKKQQPQRPIVQAQKRIDLTQLELALRGGDEMEQVRVFSMGSVSSSSPPMSSSPSPPPPPPPPPSFYPNPNAPNPLIGSPQLPPKPPPKRRFLLGMGKSQLENEEKDEEAVGRGQNEKNNYFRVESPRPIIGGGHQHRQHLMDVVHFKEEEESLSKKKSTKAKEETKKEGKKEKPEEGEIMQNNSNMNIFSPAGIQQLLFKHRQRRQSERRETSNEGRKRHKAHQDVLEDFHSSHHLPPLGLVKPARSEPRLSRSALSGALRPDSLGSSLAAFSLSQSTAALEHLERLKDRLVETKYVTAAFESRGGLGPVMDDVQSELEHWLGTKSRLLAVACEVHWSVPERFRSRQLEIQLKECLHSVLRENNRRILGLNNEEENQKTWSSSSGSQQQQRITPFPIVLAKSRTEESCARDSETDAFQGIYRRFYPALLSLQDPATVQAHKGYWTLENLADGRRSPPIARPARFLYQPNVPTQLARKSLVAVNMAVLRLCGDTRDYDAATNDDAMDGTAVKKITGKSKKKRKPFKESFF